MKKVKLLVLFSLFCLMILMPVAFASENNTVNVTTDALSAGEDNTILSVDGLNQTISAGVNDLTSDIYFDANVKDDAGDGSQYNPYKNFRSSRIKDGSTVHLANGLYYLDYSISVNKLTVVGSNPSQTVISYYAVGFKSISMLTLKNVTLIDCAISNNGNLNVENTIFKDISFYNAISSSGESSTVNLNNCTFLNNYYSSNGGAISINDGELTINNSRFYNNRAENGGAISIKNGNAVIENTVFDSNSATLLGGAIYLIDSKMESNYLEIYNCTSSFGGGIISLSSGLTLNNFIGKNNKAKYYGGAVFSIYDTFYLNDALLDNNTADMGGALYVEEVVDFLAQNNKFINNVALDKGGAVYSSISLVNSWGSILDPYYNNSFSDNYAPIGEDVHEINDPDFIGDGDYILIRHDSSNEKLPSKYDLRSLNQVTPVKDQGSGGNCWAFTALAALESCILKAYNKSYDLSEENIKNLMAMYSSFGWAMETNGGGYDKMAVAYLTSWLGPINETDDPYDADAIMSPVLKSFFHIQNIAYLTRTSYTDNNAIKRAIMDYGAVATSIFWSSSYLQKSSYYYSGSSGANHAVAIVGWDDTYSRSNFKTTPAGDGAWIVKNSWGTKGGDNGYFYVSYYDVRCAPLNKPESTYTFIFNDTIKFDKNYQYDIPGKTDFFINSTRTVWYKNIFTATDDEFLAAVSTYFDKNTTWELSIYVNNESKLIQKGFTSPGYRTINLNQLIPLNVSDAFEIVFKIVVDKEASVPISEAISLNREFYRENISFISYDGKNWVDFFDLEWEYPDHTYMGQVACIKAFTILNEINTYVNISISDIIADKTNVIASVLDEYGNLIKEGKVIFTINNVDYTVNIVNGIAELKDVLVNDGINRFDARYAGKIGYSSSANFVLVSKEIINTKITLNLSSSKYNPIVINATVCDLQGSPVQSGEVTFNIEGVDYTVKVNDGVASLTHVFNTFGLKNIEAAYDDLYCYGSSKTSKSITISGVDTSISLNVSGKYNPIVITALVVDGHGNRVDRGIVTFNVEGDNYDVVVVDGVANLTHVFAHYGTNRIQASYMDSSYVYNASSLQKYIDVSLIGTKLEVNLDSYDVFNPVEIVCTVTDLNGNPVNRGEVTFSFDDDNQKIKVYDGKAGLNYTFKNTGKNDVTIRYADDYYYASSSKSITLNISKVNVDLSLGVEELDDMYRIIVNISKPISENLYVLVDDKSYFSKSYNGQAIVDVPYLSEGNHKIKAYVSSYIYDSDIEEIDYVVDLKNTKIYCDGAFYFDKEISCPITLKDESGNAVANCKLSATINKQTYEVSTNGYGVALFKFKLNVGEYKIDIKFDGNNKYLKSELTKNVVIKSGISLPSQVKYTYNSNYKVTLRDGNGNLLKNKEISLTIGGITYSIHTNDKGVATYNIKLAKSSYTVKVKNPVTGEAKTQSISVVPRLTASGLTMYYGAGKNYKVRAFADDGNVAKNVKVAIKFNGKTYYRYTNSNGYASLKISAKAKTYTITSTYKGFSVNNKIVIKPRLITKDKAVKKSNAFKFTAKLLNTNGKIMKNKKITVKFKSKTYKVKTNKKGIATFKIKAVSKTGKYTITTIYGSLKNTNKITVKK